MNPLKSTTTSDISSLGSPASPEPSDRPNLLVFPPLIPIGGLLFGLVLEKIFPLARQVSWLPASVRWTFAAAVFLVGSLFFASSQVAMRKAKTNINPRRPTVKLVEAWPFTWSRNPMYLGGDLLFVGLSLAFRLYWLVLLFPIMQILLHHGVVLREEAYLERKFGASYLNHKNRVRRWL